MLQGNSIKQGISSHILFANLNHLFIQTQSPSDMVVRSGLHDQLAKKDIGGNGTKPV